MFIELAHKLETDLVKIFSGPTRAAGRRRAMEMLAKSAKRAEAYGVKLGVENIWDYHFGKIQGMKEGFEEIGSEALAALVYVSNFYVAKEPG